MNKKQLIGFFQVWSQSFPLAISGQEIQCFKRKYIFQQGLVFGINE